MNNLFDKCILLMVGALVFLLFGVLSYEPKPIIYDGFRAKDMYVELPDLVREEPKVTEPECLEVWREFNRKIAQVPITITYPKLVLGNEYRVFLTAYCAEECGWNYSTSSGAECHRSSEDNRYEPSTCAVDLSYFSYETMFYVPSEDRVYIAEDTGAFRGLWLDLYQDAMSDVISYDTRYENIYICWFEEVKETYYSFGAVNYLLYEEQGIQTDFR